MFIVAIESKQNAEKKGGMAKAYLARLRPAMGGGVDREFARKEKELNSGNRRAFRMDAQAGDVFEARRWDWDGERYAGGAVWFGIQGDGAIYPLTREEAMASVTMVQLGCDLEIGGEHLFVKRPARIVPAGVFCCAKN